jgi:hypothetical protein
MGSSARTQESGSFHVERFFSDKLGEPILVRCWCGIGHDHSYADWVERYHDEAEAEAQLGLTTYRPVVEAPSAAPMWQGLD